MTSRSATLPLLQPAGGCPALFAFDVERPTTHNRYNPPALMSHHRKITDKVVQQYSRECATSNVRKNRTIFTIDSAGSGTRVLYPQSLMINISPCTDHTSQSNREAFWLLYFDSARDFFFGSYFVRKEQRPEVGDFSI